MDKNNKLKRCQATLNFEFSLFENSYLHVHGPCKRDLDLKSTVN